eukprot:9963276-Prorocentrum_lima.AAC.1
MEFERAISKFILMMKRVGLLGPEEGDDAEVRVLNRILRYNKGRGLSNGKRTRDMRISPFKLWDCSRHQTD